MYWSISPFQQVLDAETPDPPGCVRVTDDVDGAAVAQQVIELCVGMELVDPLRIDQEQPPGEFRRDPRVVEEYFFLPMAGTKSDQVVLLADDVDQLELLEQRSERAQTPPPTSGRVLDGDGERAARPSNRKLRKVCPDRPLGPVGDEEIHAGHARQRNLALLVTDGEIVAAAIVEVAHACDAHAVAVDGHARHDRHFRPPFAVVGGLDRRPCDQDDGITRRRMPRAGARCAAPTGPRSRSR